MSKTRTIIAGGLAVVTLTFAGCEATKHGSARIRVTGRDVTALLQAGDYAAYCGGDVFVERKDDGTVEVLATSCDK